MAATPQQSVLHQQLGEAATLEESVGPDAASLSAVEQTLRVAVDDETISYAHLEDARTPEQRSRISREHDVSTEKRHVPDPSSSTPTLGPHFPFMDELTDEQVQYREIMYEMRTALYRLQDHTSGQIHAIRAGLTHWPSHLTPNEMYWSLIGLNNAVEMHTKAASNASRMLKPFLQTLAVQAGADVWDLHYRIVNSPANSKDRSHDMDADQDSQFPNIDVVESCDGDGNEHGAQA